MRCDAGSGNVTAIRLPCPARPCFSGILPGNLAELRDLMELDLNGHDFSGPLPGSAWASGFDSLETLRLNYNNLTGRLPPEWGSSGGALPRLRRLFLNANQLEGDLPCSWGGGGGASAAAGDANSNASSSSSLPFQRLELLFLGDNRLTGDLPDAWAQPGAFPSLFLLNLAGGNRLNRLPASWGSPGAWPQLADLVLINCGLSGPLAPEWAQPGAFPALQGLLLAFNQLSGPALPAAWMAPDAWPALRDLYLHHNALVGPLPDVGNGGSMAQLRCVQRPPPAPLQARGAALQSVISTRHAGRCTLFACLRNRTAKLLGVAGMQGSALHAICARQQQA